MLSPVYKGGLWVSCYSCLQGSYPLSVLSISPSSAASDLGLVPVFEGLVRATGSGSRPNNSLSSSALSLGLQKAPAPGPVPAQLRPNPREVKKIKEKESKMKKKKELETRETATLIGACVM